MLLRPFTSVTSLTGPLCIPIRTRNLRVCLERLRNLERTLRRFLRAVPKDQRHPIAGRQPNELLVWRLRDLPRRQHDLG